PRRGFGLWQRLTELERDLLALSLSELHGAARIGAPGGLDDDFVIAGIDGQRQAQARVTELHAVTQNRNVSNRSVGELQRQVRYARLERFGALGRERDALIGGR